jgi:hypothetical protein
MGRRCNCFRTMDDETLPWDAKNFSAASRLPRWLTANLELTRIARRANNPGILRRAVVATSVVVAYIVRLLTNGHMLCRSHSAIEYAA